jgi:hypothetical protein
MKKIFLIMIATGQLYSQSTFYYKNDKKVFLVQKQKIERSVGVLHYHDSNGNKVDIDKKILLQLKKGIEIKSLLDSYDIVVLEKIDSDIYVVLCRDVSVTFDVANSLYHDDGVLYAHPNFIRKRVMR